MHEMREMRELPEPLEILAALGDFPGASASRLAGGIDARMWRVEMAGQPFALRLLSADQHHQAQRELAISRWVTGLAVPVPRILATATWHDCPVSLAEWVDGQTLAETVLAQPAQVEPLGRAFGAMQASIHQHPPPTDDVITGRDWRTWAPLDDDLARQLDTFADRQQSLLHLDYHPLNLLVDRGRITGVLDWANCHIGDPRADLARTLAILELSPLTDPDAIQLLQTFLAAWRAGYREIAGWFETPPLFRAWAGAAMEQDLAPKIGHPDAAWLDAPHLARIRAWTDSARDELAAESSSLR